MSHSVRLTQPAREDVRDAVRWYESQQKGVGRRLLDELRRSVNAVSERPYSFPIVHRDMRRALLHRFPYGIFFFEDGQTIIICGVFDMRRSPRTWQQRRNGV